MAITEKVLAERLKQARREAGISQGVAARALKLPRPTISMIESSKRGVDTLELVTLAELYRKPLGFFLDSHVEAANKEGTLAMLFRAEKLDKKDMRVIHDFEELCRDYARLEKLMGYPVPSALPLRFQADPPSSKWEAIQQAEHLAVEVRKLLGLGDAPVADIVDLLEQQGVRIVIQPMKSDRFSGLFREDEEVGPCILVNASLWPARIAYTVAHEYGHVLLDGQVGTKKCDGEKDLLDVRADAFAAAFLMPAKGVEKFLKMVGKTKPGKDSLEVKEIVALRRHFGVSYPALLYRLMNLEWISREYHKNFEKASSQWNRLERSLYGRNTSAVELRYEDEPSLPNRYQHMALTAYRQGKISIGKLAELLRKDSYEVRTLVKDLKISN